jgi:tetratricopeptide (TPR) repeat protein
MTDWFRRKSWTRTDEEEFFNKLSRARKDGRGQYLKIQAIELLETRDSNLLTVAENLLNKFLTEYSNDDFNKAAVLYTLGEIYKIRQDYPKAIEFYKQAIDFEKDYPRVVTQAYLDYSELVVKSGDTTLFDEVELLLLERLPSLLFPVDKYKVNSLLSIISKHKNNTEEARRYAEVADKYTSVETSGLQYHKYLGVVQDRDTWLDRLVHDK